MQARIAFTALLIARIYQNCRSLAANISMIFLLTMSSVSHLSYNACLNPAQTHWSVPRKQLQFIN